MEPASTRKRKRSAIACTTCHARKVRCNIASQGIPCTNCAQDETSCKIYGKLSAANRQGQLIRPIRPREGPARKSTGPYPLTPSSGSVHPAEVLHQDEGAARDEGSGTTGAPPDVESTPQTPRRPNASSDIMNAHQHATGAINDTKHEKSRGPESTKDILVPYYAGEAEGLEFLFDLCSPNRPIKGIPYIINRNIHKRERFRPEVTTGSRPLFSSSLCLQFLRSYFYYVHPFLPVVNAGDFLSKYAEDPNKVSCLLQWSMYFASASYLDQDAIKATGLRSRKALKEFCYQNAKRIYESQQETDKTTLISSALLLAFWYVDLEDIDGCSYWIGVATHLCHTIGLHREPHYARLPRCPFPVSLQSLWRRIWWCCYYRDAWLALGTGRPMKIRLDDCDIELPTVDDILGDLRDLSSELQDAFIPSDLGDLAQLWISLLQLSVKLEDAMVLHYRPRRPPLSLSRIEDDFADISHLLSSLPEESEQQSRNLILHLCHLKCYFNAVTVVLHRAYMLSTPDHLTPLEQSNLQITAIQRCKAAAAGTTTILNRLIAEDMIETSPTMIVTAMMFAMQIHFYELARSDGLARQHACHNFNLYMIVLSHLKKSFWTAEMHQNLFGECLKALANPKPSESRQYALSSEAATQQHPHPHHRQETPTTAAAAASSNSPTHQMREDQIYTMSSILEAGGLGENVFEDFFASFGPFDNFQGLFDASDVVEDWNTTSPMM